MTKATWSFNEERIHLETIINARFNFLFIVTGFFAAGMYSKDYEDYKIEVLAFGFIFLGLLALTIYRAQQKLDLNYEAIDTNKSNSKHPGTYINRISDGMSTRRIIGYGIPTLCWHIPLYFILLHGPSVSLPTILFSGLFYFSLWYCLITYQFISYPFKRCVDNFLNFQINFNYKKTKIKA